MDTVNTTDIELATFGAGCFWSTEKCFRNKFENNLLSAVVGYMSDTSISDCDPVCTKSINSVEVLQISFRRQNLAYDDLVRFFFHIHDPTTLNKSGNNRTIQYRSAIFTHTREQQKIAENIRNEMQSNGKIKGQIITEIQPINGWQFNIAEEKHQNYLNKKYGWLMQS